MQVLEGHYNRGLPTVGPKIEVWIDKQLGWQKCARDTWVTNRDSTYPVTLENGKILNVPRASSYWRYQ